MNQINSELSSPTVVLMRSENRPLLEKIIQEHAQQQKEKSIKLQERATKLVEVIDRVGDIYFNFQHSRTDDVCIAQEPLSQTASMRSVKVDGYSTKQLSPWANTPAQDEQIKSRTPIEKHFEESHKHSTNTKVTNTRKEVQITEGMDQQLPHFHADTDTEPKVIEASLQQHRSATLGIESRTSKSSKMSLSRVLDIHEVLKAQHGSKKSESESNELSMDKIEKQLQDINQQLKQLKSKQHRTDEKISTLKLKACETEPNKSKGSSALQEEYTHGSVPKQDVKVIHIEIKKPSKPMILRTSRNAVILELEKDRSEDRQHAKHDCSNSIDRRSKNSSFSSIKSSRIIKISNGSCKDKQQAQPRPRFQIAKKKPLLSARIAQATRPP